MSEDPGNALLESLRAHNPWWDEGRDAFSLPARQKSDFYHLVRPGEADTQFEDQPLLGLVGRRGVGKTTLLHQFVQHRLETGAEPEQFLYLPFDADPLYQLRSDEQLRQAVRYYRSRVLGRLDDPDSHFLLLDDVHRIEHPTKPDVEGWGTPVRDLLEADAEGRHVVVTASAGIQVERELERVGTSASSFDTQPILPEKFRDYVYTLYPAFEDEGYRVSPSPLRTGEGSLPRACETGEAEPFVDELRAQHDRVATIAPRIQSQVVHYLAMGGVLSYDLEGAVESAADLQTEAYEHLREDVRSALYQEVPGFESIQTIADLERLCALAARRRATEPIRYQELVDLFDVDRRTLSDSYLSALAQLYLLTPATEYDNQRPRSVRLYLRDTGLATALVDGDARPVLEEFEREAQLARLAAYDHTMRFAYGIQAARGYEPDPTVRFWQGRDGEVDFVFELGDTPIPVGLAYRPGEKAPVTDALEEFRAAYDAPIGLLVTGDTVQGDEAVAYESDRGLVRLPYWLYLLLC